MKHLPTLLLSSIILLLFSFYQNLSAQSLTNIRLTSGITVVRYPITVGNYVLQQTAEKDIRFSLTNLSNSSINRAFRLYMLPLPSGTPVILWETVQTFSPYQTIAFDRNGHPNLGSVVTQNVGSYRLELRGSDVANVSTVRLTSPLVPHISGTNPATIKIISSAPTLSLVMETQGTTAVKYPLPIGSLILQYQKEKNITFSIRNLSNSAINRAFRLYMVPVTPGPSVVLWERVLSFSANQTFAFNRTNSPELGDLVTQLPGQYRLELRGSDIPDVTTVIATAPLVPVSGAVNPVTITVVECPDDYLAITPVGPITLCFGQTQTLTTGFSPAFSYQWRNFGVNINGANSNVYTATVSGSYDVVITKIGCPSFTAPPVSVTIYPQIVPTIAGLAGQYSNQDIPVTLTGSPLGGTFSGNGMNGNIFDPNVAGPGTHTITYSGSLNGCSYTISQNVIVINCPGQIVIAPGGPINLCPGEEILLNVPNDPTFTYQWRNDGVNISGQNNPSYVANSTGKYEVLITKTGCTPYLTPQVIVTAQPVINATITGITPTVSNLSPPIALTGSPAGGTFSGNGISGNLFNPGVAGIGTHTITYSGMLNGCPYTTSIQVTVILCPGVTNISPAGPHNLCFGQTISLNVPGNVLFSYQWRRNGTPIPFATTAGYIVNQSGNYDVMISRPGCTTVITAVISVTIQAQITPSISGLLAQYSNQAPPVTMTGNPAGGTFTGNGVTGNTFNPSIAGVGTHTITYSGTLNGCAYTTSRQVTVISCPATINITASGPLTVCFGGSVVLNAPIDPTFSYQWQRNVTSISGAVNSSYTATLSGSYTVIVSKTGCTSVTSNALNITVQPQIVGGITGLADQYDTNSPAVTLTGSPAGGIFTGAGMSGNQFNPASAGVGTHIITYSGTLNGCSYIFRDTTRVIPPDLCANPVYDRGSRANNGEFYATIDFDNDGRLDVLTIKNTQGRLNFYRNNGLNFDPGFGFNVPDFPYIRIPYSGAAESENVHYADFDNDGVKDLLISFFNPGNCSNSLVRIYWGTAAPPYFNALTFTNLPLSGSLCSIGFGTDYDSNGLRDVFIETAVGTDRMFKNNGARNFTAVTPTAITSRNAYHVVKDWNGDGREDLLTVDLNAGDNVYGLFYFQGIGNGNYLPPRLYYRNEQPIYPHLTLQANPNTDNRLDFVFNAQTDGSNFTRLYTGTWDMISADFTFRTQNILPPFAQLLNILDVNRDGYDDVISQYFGNNGDIVLGANLNDGNGNFSPFRILARSFGYSFHGVYNFGDRCFKAIGTSTDTIAVFNVDITKPPIQVRLEKNSVLQDASLSVYPNPTNGLLNLDFTTSSTGVLTINVLDVTGRIIHTEIRDVQKGNQSLTIDLTGKTAGIYFLKVESSEKSWTSKVVLE